MDFPMDFWLFWMCFINGLFKVIYNLSTTSGHRISHVDTGSISYILRTFFLSYLPSWCSRPAPWESGTPGSRRTDRPPYRRPPCAAPAGSRSPEQPNIFHYSSVPGPYVFGPPGSGSGFCCQLAKNWGKPWFLEFTSEKKHIFCLYLEIKCTYRK